MDVVANVYNPCTQEAEVNRPSPWSTWVLCNEPVSRKDQKMKRKITTTRIRLKRLKILAIKWLNEE
jgi:hypothetical protein